MRPVTPLILGLAGPQLTAEEKAYLADNPPAGFILFARNIETPHQTAALCAELAVYSPFRTPFIAVDQEGGRVQRVTFAGQNPPARIFGEWYAQNPAVAVEACTLNALLLAAQLRAVGANWVMGPVLDLALPETHAIIGDRAFAAEPGAVAALGHAFLEGVRQGGCWGCMKHAPGHGRATADSHLELPVVEASAEALAQDFAPFTALAPQADFMMTAHIRFPALDAGHPATTSPPLLRMMREDWGFKGLIMADDVGMKALGGPYVGRIEAALAAGCDVAIASLSQLRHGMAGTVFDAPHFADLQAARLSVLHEKNQKFMDNLKLPDAPDAETVASATRRLKALWADGPARMGYALAL